MDMIVDENKKFLPTIKSKIKTIHRKLYLRYFPSMLYFLIILN